MYVSLAIYKAKAKKKKYKQKEKSLNARTSNYKLHKDPRDTSWDISSSSCQVDVTEIVVSQKKARSQKMQFSNLFKF